MVKARHTIKCNYVNVREARSPMLDADCAVRLASILMLECGQRSSNDHISYQRLLKASIKSAQLCQDCQIPALAYKLLERASDYQEQLSLLCLDTVAKPDRHDEEAIAELNADYFLVRIRSARFLRTARLNR